MRRNIEERFILFGSAEECAREAAPVFAENRWQWSSGLHSMYIPNEAAILATLRSLRETFQEFNNGERHTELVESGRLIATHTKYGFERNGKKSKGLRCPACNGTGLAKSVPHESPNSHIDSEYTEGDKEHAEE